jgi:hypothetical protein
MRNALATGCLVNAVATDAQQLRHIISVEDLTDTIMDLTG